MAKAILTQADVRRLFEYDAVRGVLIWRERPSSDFKNGRNAQWNKRYAGQIAGSKNRAGYRFVHLKGFSYGAHRLIWLYVKGESPDEIDHQFGIEVGDSVENLCAATHAENMKNKKLYKSNRYGAAGVDISRGKWRAQIKVSGRTIHLGMFLDKAAAIASRKAAEIKYGFHESHGRTPQEGT